jgi:hypothetical protein
VRLRRTVVAVLVFVLAWAGYSTSASAEIGDHPVNGPAVAYAPAVRLDPPPPPPPPPPQPPVLWTTESANGRCVGLIGALQYWNPGWDVNRMAGIAYRESRCQPSASNSCCSGVFQIHQIWIPKAAMCGVYSRADLLDPWRNICVASIIFRQQGMSAWSQTS